MLPILFAVVVIDLIGFGIAIPILPFYAREYGASGLELGALLTSYAVMQFAFAPLWGRLSDRIGRRPVLLVTIAGTAGSLLLLGLADSLAWLFAARVAGGIFAANVSVATAYVGDVTDESERTRKMGMIGASFAIGFLVGPALGGALSPEVTGSSFGYGLPMLAAALLAGLNWIFAVAFLREPDVHRSPDAGGVGPLEVLRDPVVRRLCSVYFLFSVAVTQLETVFAFWMMDRFGYGARDVAVLLVGMALLMGAIQGGGMRALVPRYGEKRLLVSGTLLLAAGFISLPTAPSVAVLLAPLALCAVGRAISHPPLLGMVSIAGEASQRGAVMGTFQSSASLARVVGPLAAGALYDLRDIAPFALAVMLLLFAGGLALGLPRVTKVPQGDRASSTPARPSVTRTARSGG